MIKCKFTKCNNLLVLFLNYLFIFSYVQHRILEQAEWLREQIINKNGLILLAGNSKNMPKAVKEAFSMALNEPDYLEAMIASGRYQEETWA